MLCSTVAPLALKKRAGARAQGRRALGPPQTRRENLDLEYVHQLFIPGTRVWDEQLVRNSFAVLDAEEILKLKPGSRMTDDVLAVGVMGLAHSF